MQFLLVGFTHEAASRVFEFQDTSSDRTQPNYFVSVDLMLVRRYGIRMQELPLLCLRFLEGNTSVDQERALTYAEEDMRQHMNCSTAEREAALKRRTARRAPPNAGKNRLHLSFEKTRESLPENA